MTLDDLERQNRGFYRFFSSKNDQFKHDGSCRWIKAVSPTPTLQSFLPETEVQPLEPPMSRRFYRTSSTSPHRQ